MEENKTEEVVETVETAPEVVAETPTESPSGVPKEYFEDMV